MDFDWNGVVPSTVGLGTLLLYLNMMTGLFFFCYTFISEYKTSKRNQEHQTHIDLILVVYLCLMFVDFPGELFHGQR